MARQLRRATLVSLATAAAIAVILAVVFMWRLSQGPLALSFLTAHVQQMMNANLTGMRAEIGDVIIERDRDSGAPRFRLRDIRIADLAGNTIARAPRAAVNVNGRALLAGRVEPVELDLIGPRLVVRRQLDGTLHLGSGSGPGQPAEGDSGMGAAGKADRSDAVVAAEPMPPEVHTGNIIDFLGRELIAQGKRPSAISALQSLRISQASISLYDEANEAWWHAPQANLVFRRVSYGFAVFADAAIASGRSPWRTEVVATYKSEARTLSLSARIFDLVPADIADDVFALSKLAQVRLPLAGHAEVEFAKGVVVKASAELTASAGEVGFPDYISEPLIVDEGLLRLDYQPESGDIVIGESAISIAGVPTRLTGRIEPVRSDTGKLAAIRFALAATSAGGAPATAGEPLALDRVEVRGLAAIEEARLDLDDLVLMSGNSGLRLRGRLVGGDGAVGVFVDGVARDLTADQVKRLWPPIIAPGARKWIRNNVIDGRIPEATLRVAVPAAAVTAALDGRGIPDEMVSLSFSLSDIVTRYFHELPPLRGASGAGRITGDTFRLELADGRVALPSGAEIEFRRGTMTTTGIGHDVSPTVLQVTAAAAARPLLELIDHEPLRLVSQAGFASSQVDGEAEVEVTIELPLARQIPKEAVRVVAHAELTKAVFHDAIEGLTIDDGRLAVAVDEAGVRAEGPVRLNGAAATLRWSRGLGPAAGGEDVITVEAELDEADRQRLGADIEAFVRGPVKVKLSASASGGRIVRAHVDADLTRAELRVDAIGWTRPAGLQASAAFDLDLSNHNSIVIDNIDIGGDRLKLNGRLKLDRKGKLIEASLPTVKLDELTDMAVKLSAHADRLALSATGRSFDARPIIANLFSTSPSPALADALPMRIEATFDRVHTNRGEVVVGVSGSLDIVGGVVEAADLSGRFVNGEPVTLQVVPAASDLRELRLIGGDGGAALRAANLYSKIAGGAIDFQAWLGPGRRGTVQRGLLVVRDFEVRNEVVLTELDERSGGNVRIAAARRGALQFSKLSLPFSVDDSYVLIGDALIKGPELGASAQGQIRKIDGRMDIGGTIIPAYALNAALGEVPVLGQLLTGGKGEGIFGLTYALKGTMRDPQFLVNPVSAIAPGILRRLFEFGGGGVAADGTKAPPRRPRVVDR